MMDEETSDLKKEIARLNHIITVLVEQNEVLRKENSYVKTYIESLRAGYSDDKTVIGEGNVPLSNDKIEIGEGKVPSSNDKTYIGESNVLPSNDKIYIGSGSFPLSYEEIIIGKGKVPEPVRNTEIGKTAVPKPLPETWDAVESNVRLVASRLKYVGLGNAKKAGKKTIARLLLHFYNKGRGDYSELRKLTGLSEGGLAKTIMSLKKRGLITRTAYQQFEISVSARQLLHDAYQFKGKGLFFAKEK